MRVLLAILAAAALSAADFDAPRISPADYLGHIKFLASPDMKVDHKRSG